MRNEDRAIIVSNVHKSYGSVKALRGVNLSASKGKILGLLGPNGAGKTTLVRIMTTLLKPDSGAVTILGVDVLKNPAAARRLIGLASQYAAIDPNLTGLENLMLIGKLGHLPSKMARRRAYELLEEFSLAEDSHRATRAYSGGMRRKLDLAASLMGDPEILFLDEPTAGLDPASRRSLWDVLEKLAAGGKTVLLTTQYLDEADHLADYIAVMNRGIIAAHDSPENLKRRIGGDVLEIHLENRAESDKAAEFLNQLGSERRLDRETGRIIISISNGTRSLVEAVRRMDSAGIKIEDIVLRHPTLDEVFLQLTAKARVKF